MFLSEIERMAGKGNIAPGQFNIASTLRFEVLPEFYRRVGDVTWLRRITSVTHAPPTRVYDLPRDFRSMITVGTCSGPLKYIGEDPELMAAAELAVTPSSPRGYYIVHSSNSKWRAIKFDAPSDMTYTVPCVYRSRLELVNDAEDLELDAYIPEDYQQALVQGLKREIYMDRFGQGDARYQIAAAKFLEICEEAREQAHDLATRNYAVYCD